MTIETSQPAYDAESLAQLGIHAQQLPKHLAIIMDGNGRWAKRQGWRRVKGHERGAQVVRSVTTECARMGMGWLTLYAFSSENWSRPAREIDYLMGLLGDFLEGELSTLQDNNIRFRVIGEWERLPERVRGLAQTNIDATAANTGLTMTLALSYGGRDELVRACRLIAERVACGELEPAAINERTFGQYLYDAEAPDVDLLVRTAGEQRVSNFLVWQSVYAEYVSVDPCWPDFSNDVLHGALRTFQQRTRSFGKVVDES